MKKAKPAETSQVKFYEPYLSPFDPCFEQAIVKKSYQTPPHLYMGFQPRGLRQWHPLEALMRGTLWPALYSPYEGRQEVKR